MSVCRTCGVNNQDGTHFCNACGTVIAGTSLTGLLPARSLLHHGRYLIIQKVGQGGMGAVYKVQDLHSHNRVVALKEMSQDGLTGQDLQDALTAFAREAEILALLDHPSLPHVYEQFEEGGRRYLAMEFIEGETLEQRLDTLHAQGKLLPLADILAIATKLCVVLEYLHTRNPPIIFRDIKPANIIVNKQEQVYLVDFGIARLFKPQQTKDTAALGSRGYAPPEQYRQATSPRSDMYSLGATLHYMITGNDPTQNPFRFQPLSLGLPQLEYLIMSMVALDEKQRPASMVNVLQALTAIAQTPKVTPSAKTAYTTGSVPSSLSFSPITICATLSPAVQDYAVWVSLREQIVSFSEVFPSLFIKEVVVGKQSSHEQEKILDQTDLVLFLLSDVFFATPTCIALADRMLDQYKASQKMFLPILLNQCHIVGRLTAMKPIPEDSIAHRSLYAQELRILEVVKVIRKHLAEIVLAGNTIGPMNLLQWLVWQLYGDGRTSSPYFVVGSYALKYVRPSGLASMLLHALDLQNGRAVAPYIINVRDHHTFTNLLQAIAPSRTRLEAVQGIAFRDRPLEYVSL